MNDQELVVHYESILADIRDLFPEPEYHTEMDKLWLDAISDPSGVFPYVKAWTEHLIMEAL